jgi:hypothetical protein
LSKESEKEEMKEEPTNHKMLSKKRKKK